MKYICKNDVNLDSENLHKTLKKGDIVEIEIKKYCGNESIIYDCYIDNIRIPEYIMIFIGADKDDKDYDYLERMSNLLGEWFLPLEDWRQQQIDSIIED